MDGQGHLEFYFGRAGQCVPLLTAIFFIAVAAVNESNVDGYSLAFFAAIVLGGLLAKDRSAYGAAAIQGLARPMFGTVTVAIIFAAIVGRLVSGSGMIDTLAGLLIAAKLPAGAFCALSFLVCCLISLSTGTSVGTYVIATPILFPVGALLGSNPSFLIGAIVSGSLFGDNLAPISDTTIASAGTQNAPMGAVVRSRCWYSLPVAFVCLILFFMLGGSGTNGFSGDVPAQELRSLLMLAVPAIIILLCIRGMHLLSVLALGILSGVLISLAAGIYTPGELFSYPGGYAVGGMVIEAIQGTASTLFMLIGAFLFLGVVEQTGLMQLLAERIACFSRGRRSAEGSIVLSVGLLGALTGVCTVSIVALGNVVAQIGEKFGISKCRRANLMDCGGLALTSLAPWTVHAVYPATLGSLSSPDCLISPLQVVTHNLYGQLMIVLMVVAIATGYHRESQKQ